MMKWLHLPWHIEGNRIVHTIPGDVIFRFAPPYGEVPLEENRVLQFALDRIVNQNRDPWLLLKEAIEQIERAGYVLRLAREAA